MRLSVDYLVQLQKKRSLEARTKSLDRIMLDLISKSLDSFVLLLFL